MKLAFLYAGQGAQQVGMGRDLYEAYPALRSILDSAPVDFDLKNLCFEGPEEKLSDTRYTQPAMVAFAAGVTALLYEAGIRPQAAAGLSLGEYSALHAAGVFTAPQAIALAAFRGAAMADAVQGRPCGMAAVLGMARDLLPLCRRPGRLRDRQLQLPQPDRHRRGQRRGGSRLCQGYRAGGPPVRASEGQRPFPH